MFTLTKYLEDEIEIDGKVHQLDLFFDTVLLFYDLMDDDNFSDEDKVEIAFDMFVKTEGKYDFDIQFEVVQTVVSTFIQDDEQQSTGTGSSNKRLYDLEQDAEYIYASFLQEYGIDLIDQQGVLRWEKFTALLSGLRDTTQFKEIIGIRAAELPTGKGTEDERKRLTKLKQAYALKRDHEEKEQELDAMFDALAGKG